MYRKILVPLDGSSYSESIMQIARGLISECGGAPDLILFMVVEPFRNQPFRSGDDWNEKMKKEAEKVAHNYLDQLADKLKAEGIKAQSAVEYGDPAQAIMDYVKKNGVDLIVMSTHGRSGLSRMVFGSVADRIIHHSVVPVLISAPPGLRQA
jgi:nucleotide-binding universal stress UspA family protein